MLIRAILISVFLHLVMLITPSRLDGLPRTTITGAGPNALNAVIARRDGDDSLEPGIRQAVMVKAQAADRRPGALPESKTEHFNFGPFFRSTVEPAITEKAMPDRSLEVTPTDTQGASVEEIGQYRLNVARSARQFKAYPPLAREKGWEGVVLVAVVTPIGQGAPIVLLAISSGYEVLDRQALEMVTQAVNLTILPEGMRGRRLAISFPIEYRMAEQ